MWIEINADKRRLIRKYLLRCQQNSGDIVTLAYGALQIKIVGTMKSALPDDRVAANEEEIDF